MNDLKFLGEKIIENKIKIAWDVHENRIIGISEDEKKQLALVEQDIINMRTDFIQLFGETLEYGLNQDTAFEKIMTWGKNTGEVTYNMGVPLDEALKDTRFYRQAIWKALKNEIVVNNMSIDTVFEVGAVIDPLLDHAAYSFSLTYVHFHQLTLEKSKSAFLELSVPVVPITTGLAILPIIGEIDTERAALLMEATLKSANNLKLTQLILDFSGVLIIDTMVANQIFRVVESLKLLGVETILTGLRPEVSQTMVNLGIDFSHLKIRASLQQALEFSAFNLSSQKKPKSSLDKLIKKF